MKTRNNNLDLIRTTAVLSVLSVHFFRSTEYYAIPLSSITTYIATIFRTCFMVCVPLFILLSGYLMNKKTISKQYFQRLSKVLIPYILSTILIILFKIFVLKETLTLSSIFFNFTSFEQYAWYIEMYIGLYFLIPFLNLIYNNLSSRDHKKCLIAVLLFLTSVPSVVNSFGFTLIPDFWTNIYPITYYFIGAYLSEFGSQIKLSTKQLLPLFLLIVVIAGTFTFVKAYNSSFIWGSYCSWESIFNVCSTVTLFLFLLKCNLNNIPEPIGKIIFKISEVSLPLYLTSWISDIVVYKFVNLYINKFSIKLVLLPLIVLLVFIISFVMAVIINYIHSQLTKILAKR